MPRLFISYAREDGRPLADRLDTDLVTQGFEVWLDRSEITGGHQPSTMIEEAIDKCDVVVALLSRGSFKSSYCRGEQERALRQHKLVIPILVQEDADRPVYLESRHFVSFARAEAYAENLKALVSAIRADDGTRLGDLSDRDRAHLRSTGAPAALAGGGALGSWDALRSRAGTLLDRWLADVRGTDGNPGVYPKDVYVDRPEAAAALDAFVADGTCGAALVGDSGVGKTTLLCHWADGRRTAGDAVFVYDAARFLDADAMGALARDLGAPEPLNVSGVLTTLEALAMAAGRHVVVVIDGVNFFRAGAGPGPENLVRHLDDAIGRLDGAAVKIIMASGAPAWRRLEVQDTFRALHWSRYFCPGGQQTVPIDGFNLEELAAVYPRYQARFKLATPFDDLPAAIREALREPVLLRLLADSYSGRPESITEDALDLGVYRKYYERRIGRLQDQQFVEALVSKMLAQRRSTLVLQDLARDPEFGPNVTRDDPETPFRRLVDQGVLTVTRGDLFVGDAVNFTYPIIGAYSLTRVILARGGPVGGAVDELLAVTDFALAWDTAITLVVQSADGDLITALAGAEDPERRSLAAIALRRLHAISPGPTRTLLGALLDAQSEEARRTALKAAYCIGPATRDLFVRAAMAGSDELRQAAKDTLYLIWRQSAALGRRAAVDSLYLLWRRDPGFTYGLLGDLVGHLRLRDLGSIRQTLEFIIDLSVTIYVNHCDRPDVAEATSALYYEMAVNRLHLDRVSLGDTLESLLLRAVAARFATPIVAWMMWTDQPAADFGLTEDDRARLERIAHVIDPAASLEGAIDDLRALLDRDIPLLSGASGLALVVHACHDPAATMALHHALFERLTPRGRLWQVLSFSVLFPQTPAAWVEPLETWTARLLDESPAEALGDEPIANLCLVPVGFAYAKAGRPMTLHAKLLQDAMARGEAGTVRLVLAGLGAVGFYFPDAVFDTLTPLAAGLARGPSAEPFALALAMMRTLHFDAADGLLARPDIDDAFRRRVAASSDVSLVHRQLSVFGFYNNAVHFSLNYPKMRRVFSAGALELVARSATSKDFVADYAKGAIQLFRDADFRLLEWTRPEA